jgi:hypothetical protein
MTCFVRSTNQTGVFPFDESWVILWVIVSGCLMSGDYLSGSALDAGVKNTQRSK